MKRVIAAALILVSASVFSADENQQVGQLKTEVLKRTYDAEYGVVCYSTHYSSLSCVKVDKPEQKPKTTNRNEDVPE